MTIQKELDSFLKSNLRNAWLRDDYMAVYVRKGMHTLSDTSQHCLDIAAITVESDYQNKGLFKSFLAHAIKVNPFDYIYVECVHNPILVSYLEKNNWSCVLDNCYYKKFKE